MTAPRNFGGSESDLTPIQRVLVKALTMAIVKELREEAAAAAVGSSKDAEGQLNRVVELKARSTRTGISRRVLETGDPNRGDANPTGRLRPAQLPRRG